MKIVSHTKHRIQVVPETDEEKAACEQLAEWRFVEVTRGAPHSGQMLNTLNTLNQLYSTQQENCFPAGAFGGLGNRIGGFW